MRQFFYLSFMLLFTAGLYAQDYPTPEELQSLGGYADLGNEVVDLNGDGITDVINLVAKEEDGDFSNFVLMINQQEIRGKHSYNVDKFIVVDIDKSDKQKEVAVHTPNVNGPDEYIIYKYDGTEIKQIGRTYSTTTFNGDGTLDVVSYMPFWDKRDTYVYDRGTDELVMEAKKHYDIEVECEVLENFAVHPGIGKEIIGYALKGEKIKILKAIPKDNCDKTGPYAWGLCDEFYFTANNGKEGWATMEQMMGKIDLPLIP